MTWALTFSTAVAAALSSVAGEGLHCRVHFKNLCKSSILPMSLPMEEHAAQCSTATEDSTVQKEEELYETSKDWSV